MTWTAFAILAVFVLKASRNAIKHMILSFKMKGNGLYDHIDAMIHKKIRWIRSVLNLTGVGGGPVVQSPKPKSDIQSVPRGGGSFGTKS